MISDGYGDGQGSLPQEPPLEDVERLLASMVLKYTTRADSRFGDALQECRIEFWREWSKHHTTPWAVNAAKHRAYRFLHRREAATGHAAMVGRPEVQPVTSLDRPVYSDSTATLADLLGVSDLLDGIDLAYHHGEIQQAIDSLQPRDRTYVIDRFWHGLSMSEIARRDSLATSTLHNRWTRTIKPTLAKHLAHLVGAA